jgi:hypothetical protein
VCNEDFIKNANISFLTYCPSACNKSRTAKWIFMKFGTGGFSKIFSIFHFQLKLKVISDITRMYFCVHLLQKSHELAKWYLNENCSEQKL